VGTYLCGKPADSILSFTFIRISSAVCKDDEKLFTAKDAVSEEKNP